MSEVLFKKAANGVTFEARVIATDKLAPIGLVGEGPQPVDACVNLLEQLADMVAADSPAAPVVDPRIAQDLAKLQADLAGK